MALGVEALEELAVAEALEGPAVAVAEEEEEVVLEVILKLIS